MDFIGNLNPRQREAVTAEDGPLLVLAGAGSGKTKVLTSRIAYLLEEKKVPAYQILAITFTNKAAQEMRQRVETLLDTSAKGLWVFTFHAACLRMLRQQEDIYGRNRNFIIYDQDDQLTLIKECLRELNIDDKKYQPRWIASTISQAKNQLYAASDYALQAHDFGSKKVAEVYHLYTQRLVRNNAVDFDDLIMLMARLLRENPKVSEGWQQRFRYILVDEYQDTNHAQYMLVNYLAAGHRNLFVVGDPDQGIYGWRGADIGNIMSFQRDYPEALVITLEQNYRSTTTILESANMIIGNNPNRQEKKLWSALGTGEPLRTRCGANEFDEADYVVGQILYLKNLENRDYRDFAVLYRTHAQSRVLEGIFVRTGLPYTIVGGLKFYDRKEVKDIMSYLKVIVNPFDTVGLARIINVPKRGIGPASYAKITAYAREWGISPVEALNHLDDIPGLSSKVRSQGKELGEFLSFMAELGEDASVTQLTERVLEDTGYRMELLLEDTVEAHTRLENLEELMNATFEYDQREDSAGLAGFLEDVALMNQAEVPDDEVNLVRLMTLHSAKGLEFPVVFIIGMEEGIFPHARSLYEASELEEERRLCYVGITRAMERLYLTYCQRRTIYTEIVYNQPSRFLDELPPHLVDSDDHYFKISHDEDSYDKDYTRSSQNRKETANNTPQSSPEPSQPRDQLSPGDLEHLRPGDKVSHKKWGAGTVVGVDGIGEDALIKVAFPGNGVINLIAKYAPLERVM